MLLHHWLLFLLPQEEAITLPLGTGSDLRQEGRDAGKKNPLRMIDHSTLGTAMQRESPDQIRDVDLQQGPLGMFK